jgi:hypothetical protein
MYPKGYRGFESLSLRQFGLKYRDEEAEVEISRLLLFAAITDQRNC